jgi:hypothetical protein
LRCDSQQPREVLPDPLDLQPRALMKDQQRAQARLDAVQARLVHAWSLCSQFECRAICRGI